MKCNSYKLKGKYGGKKILLEESSPSFSNVLNLFNPLKKQGLIVKTILKLQSRFWFCCFLIFAYIDVLVITKVSSL